MSDLFLFVLNVGHHIYFKVFFLSLRRSLFSCLLFLLVCGCFKYLGDSFLFSSFLYLLKKFCNWLSLVPRTHVLPSTSSVYILPTSSTTLSFICVTSSEFNKLSNLRTYLIESWENLEVLCCVLIFVLSFRFHLAWWERSVLWFSNEDAPPRNGVTGVSIPSTQTMGVLIAYFVFHSDSLPPCWTGRNGDGGGRKWEEDPESQLIFIHCCIICRENLYKDTISPSSFPFLFYYTTLLWLFTILSFSPLPLPFSLSPSLSPPSLCLLSSLCFQSFLSPNTPSGVYDCTFLSQFPRSLLLVSS